MCRLTSTQPLSEAHVSLCPQRTVSALRPIACAAAHHHHALLQGSGWSEGDYVTLGKREQDDLEVAIQYLRSSGTVTTIGLWGRSMGAVTAILYAHKDPSMACLVSSGSC